MDGGFPSCCFRFRRIVFSALTSWEITLKGRETRTRMERSRSGSSDIWNGFRWFFRLSLFCQEGKGEA